MASMPALHWHYYAPLPVCLTAKFQIALCSCLYLVFVVHIWMKSLLLLLADQVAAPGRPQPGAAGWG
jgi:hypothetical protein